MIGMPDREKISGFELCANGEPCIGEKFTKCPFSPRNNNEQNCGVTMARFALALLKEQEAKMVLHREERSVIPVKALSGFCPKCSHTLIYGMNKHFCGNCGQEVKWDEDQ